MHFLKDNERRLNRPRFTPLNRGFKKLFFWVAYVADPSRAFFRGEERARPMGVLLLILVVLLHIWLARKLLVPVAQRHPKTKPVVIELSLMAMPLAQQVKTAPSVPAPAAVAEPSNISKPKIVASKKELPKKKMPVAHRQPTVPKPIADKPVPTQQQAAAVDLAPRFEIVKPVDIAPAVKPSSTAIAPVARAESGRATCVVCPALKFPAIAQRRGWQGSVLLKFELTADGMARNITVGQSSGHELLDEAAIENAKESRFTATTAGEIRKVTKSYKFTLKEE